MLRTLELMLWSVLLVWVCVVWWKIYHTAWQAGETERRKRRLKACSPEDCPACQSRQSLRGVNSRPTQEVRPGSEVKGKGGRKKQSNTEGHACPNPACAYHGIRDQTIHALVRQEQRGQTGAIWRLRCQACGGVGSPSQAQNTEELVDATEPQPQSQSAQETYRQAWPQARPSGTQSSECRT